MINRLAGPVQPPTGVDLWRREILDNGLAFRLEVRAAAGKFALFHAIAHRLQPLEDRALGRLQRTYATRGRLVRHWPRKVRPVQASQGEGD